VHSNNLEKLKNLSTLSPLYEHRNLAFIGPPGIGKTHLSMAFGRACCELGNKVYFLKATELNQRLTQARKNDSVGSTTSQAVLLLMKWEDASLTKRIQESSLMS